MKMGRTTLFISLVQLCAFLQAGTAQLMESERLVEYHKRNYTWPPTAYVPNTLGQKHVMEQRLHQLGCIPDKNARYEGMLQTLYPAIVLPNFTTTGFGFCAQCCPTELLQTLQQAIQEGLSPSSNGGNGPGNETPGATDGPIPALFVDRPDLTRRVLHELQPLVEAWVQLPLVPNKVYGFRIYQNQSKLYMHVDKRETHLLSFILHLDSSIDAGTCHTRNGPNVFFFFALPLLSSQQPLCLPFP
jgi:hypothetical protein